MKYRLFILGIILFIFKNSLVAEERDRDAWFIAGNEAYAKGDYHEAIESYKAALKQGHSAAVYHNLGNAYFHKGKMGKAILSYERAISLNPWDEDTQRNLEFVNQAVQLDAKSKIQQAFDYLTVNMSTDLSSICFWVFIFGVFFLSFYKGLKLFLSLLTTICFLGMIIAGIGLYNYYEKRRTFIITMNQIPMKVSPTSTAAAVDYLKEGEWVEMEKEHENHYFVHRKAGRKGWIQRDQAEGIWAESP